MIHRAVSIDHKRKRTGYGHEKRPTTNEVPHATSAIRSIMMGCNAHVSASCLSRRGRHRRTLGHPIVYLDAGVVNPRGKSVCEPVGSMCDGENFIRQSQEVLWHSSAICRTASGSVGLARASLAGGGIEEKIVEL